MGQDITSDFLRVAATSSFELSGGTNWNKFEKIQIDIINIFTLIVLLVFLYAGWLV